MAKRFSVQKFVYTKNVLKWQILTGLILKVYLYLMMVCPHKGLLL